MQWSEGDYSSDGLDQMRRFKDGESGQEDRVLLG